MRAKTNFAIAAVVWTLIATPARTQTVTPIEVPGGAQGFAQLPATEALKWEIEVHAGVARAGKPTGATTAMLAAGDAFTTGNDRPSRYVSSWYFGDGAALLNQQLAAFITPRTGRITSLDPVLTGPAARSSDAGRFGLRVGRRLTPRFTAELNVDYGSSTLELLDSMLGDIEASRTTFASVFNEAFGPGMPFQNAVVSSSSEIEEGGGGQIVATGALTVKLRRNGALVPFVTGGLGGVFNRGSDPSVTLRGNYSFLYILGEPFNVNESDTVTVRWVRPDRALVGLVGSGLTYDLSARHGFRVDLRLHLKPNAVDTEVSASPAMTVGTPPRRIASATTPSVQYTNNPELTAARSTLSGPQITAFRTREGSGWQIDTALTVGYFWRF